MTIACCQRLEQPRENSSRRVGGASLSEAPLTLASWQPGLLKFAFGLVVSLTWLILLGSSIPACSQPEGPVTLAPLSLDQAIKLAQFNNRLIKNAELDLGRSGDRLAIERTNLLPTFKFNALGAQLLTPLDFKFDRATSKK